ncbi:MAG: type II toxin-antitoxin system YafQ family toxin [Sphingomonadaceae bacterium]|nr:type II toxin-antitoxin system YafQ family toxin [Sphingomonadaceae bacterium]
MRTPVSSTAFRKDTKRCQKRGKDMAKLRAVILLLIEDAPLEPRHRDHPLKGEWAGYRDLHVEPDWVLIYRVTEEELLLARTGTHSDLFGE